MSEMRLTFSKTWLLLPGLILLIVGGLTWNALQGVSISYPFGTWRMDLDDAISNVWLGLAAIGTFLLGIAAFRKADTADRRSKRVEHTINGGMAEAADQHAAEAMDRTDLEPGLWKRVVVLEEDRDLWKSSAEGCMERETRMKALMQDVYRRLDEAGLGRGEERQDVLRS